jgi:hypothetical protein
MILVYIYKSGVMIYFTTAAEENVNDKHNIASHI